jgi:hypothetical protein
VKTSNILATCKKAAGSCRWSHKDGKFIATFGGRGIATIIGPTWPRHQIVTKAMAIERELIAAKRGELDAETSELWDRKTGKRILTGAPLRNLEDPRK